ncbi:MAG: hypothetical protein V8R80_09870 [Eubacterium sp.]
MTGEQVANAQAESYNDEKTGAVEYIVDLTLTKEGAEIFADKTEEYLGKALPIILTVNASVIRL